MILGLSDCSRRVDAFAITMLLANLSHGDVSKVFCFDDVSFDKDLDVASRHGATDSELVLFKLVFEELRK